MRRLSAGIGVVFALALGCAQGQDLKSAQACTRLGDDASRLACYDAALGHNAALGAAKPPTTGQTVQQSDVAKTEAPAKFGDDGRLHPHANTDLPKTLTAQVQQVTPLPTGLYRLALDNGQIWNTTQAD